MPTVGRCVQRGRLYETVDFFLHRDLKHRSYTIQNSFIRFSTFITYHLSTSTPVLVRKEDPFNLNIS
jgi:hypothetical protein